MVRKILKELSQLLNKQATNETCHAYTPPDTVINRASKASDLGIQQTTFN